MFQNCSVAVFTHSVSLYEKVAPVMKHLGLPANQFSYVDRAETLARWAGDTTLIALLDATQNPEACMRWLKTLTSAEGTVVPVWIDKQFCQPAIVDAIRAGAADLLIGDFSEGDLIDLVKRVSEHCLEHREASSIVAVTGVTGGAGASTLVANLAVELAEREHVPVGILDLDPWLSGAGLLLNLRPETTLFDLHERGTEPDLALLTQIAAQHESGVSLISCQGWPTEQLPQPASLIRRVLSLLQQKYPYVLVDVPRLLFPPGAMLLDAIEAVILVSQYSMTAAAGACQMLQALDAHGYPNHRRLLVANSVCEPAGITPRQWKNALGRKPLVSIPCDIDAVNRSVAAGQPLSCVAPRSATTRAIGELADILRQRVKRQGAVGHELQESLRD